MKLATTIRDLRYAKGWGPDELANRSRISRTALYQIERGGTSKPQAGTLKKISRALGVPLEVLISGSSDSHNGIAAESGATVAEVPVSDVSRRIPEPERARELVEKFRLLLSSPLAEGIARIVEESFRLLPIIPPPGSADRPR